jgi:hypothetical protein
MYDSISSFFCSLIIGNNYDVDDDLDGDVDDNNDYREGTSTKEVDVVVRKVETSGTDEEQYTGLCLIIIFIISIIIMIIITFIVIIMQYKQHDNYLATIL